MVIKHKTELVLSIHYEVHNEVHNIHKCMYNLTDYTMILSLVAFFFS